MLLLIEANHGQSTQRRIFISVETTDLDEYANKICQKNDCFIDLEVGKQCLSFLLAVNSEKMFASDVFPDKNQKPLRMSRMQITKQAVAILSLYFWYWFVVLLSHSEFTLSPHKASWNIYLTRPIILTSNELDPNMKQPNWP